MGILIEPHAIRRLSRHATATLLSVARRPLRRDIAMTFLAWAGYFMLTAVVFVVISWIVPTIDDQAQQIGFSTEGPLLDKLLLCGDCSGGAGLSKRSCSWLFVWQPTPPCAVVAGGRYGKCAVWRGSRPMECRHRRGDIEYDRVLPT